MKTLKIITIIVMSIYTLVAPLVLILVLMGGDSTFGPKSGAEKLVSYIVAGLVAVYTVVQWMLLGRYKKSGSKLGISILFAVPIVSTIIYIVWTGLTSST